MAVSTPTTHPRGSMRVMLRAATVAIVAVTALILTGCVATETEYAHGSREKLYSSVEEVASDSSAIVIGTVSSSTIVKDEYGAPATVSQFQVFEVVQGGQTEGKGAANAGDSLGIRQLGPSETLGLGAPILESGKTYLLFLTASMLQGEVEATQFHVTGASAGYYELDGSLTEELSTATFQKVGDEGDPLPITLTISETANLTSSVTATAPSNASSTHYYSNSGNFFSFTGITTKKSTNASWGGSTGWEIYSPYSLSNAYNTCGPNPV